MKTILIICCLLVANLSYGQELKIMPLGNSITFGEDSSDERTEGDSSQNCVAYRKSLYELLISAGYTFNYVGSQKSGWAAGLNEVNAYNAGFPGINPAQLSTLLRTGRNLHWGGDCELNSYGGCPQNYLTLFEPDVILLHIGTNDMESYADAAEFRDSVNSILNIIDSYEISAGKTVPVFLAQILRGAGNYYRNEFYTYYNDLLYDLVNSRTSDEIILIDMENIPGFNYTIGGDMFDTWHPNPSGYLKMANRWFSYMQTYNFRAPVVSDIPDLTINENETSKTINLNNYVFDPQDPDNAITWTFTPNPASHFNISIASGIATISAKNSSWTGNETITFKASDNGHGGTPLFDTDEVTLYSVAVNDTPVIQSQQPISIPEDSQVTVQFSHLTVVDDNSYPAEFTLHVLAGSNYAVINNYTVKPNPNFNGTLHVPVYVNDGSLNSNTFSLTITVTPVNDSPWLNIPSGRTATEGSQYSITVSPDDVDLGDILTMSSVNMADWLSFNTITGLLRGTPHNNDVGIQSVTIRVNDGTVNVDSTFVIEVINTNDVPYFTSYPENTTVYGGELFEYYVMAQDSDLNDILSYTAVTIPSFLTFNNETHRLSGTPMNSDTGTYAVSLRVGDGTINIYQNFSLRVMPKKHAPEIISSHIDTVSEDTQYLYALKATDADNDLLTYEAIEIPDWLVFYPSGILIGTPANQNVGIQDVILSVTDGTYTVYDSFAIEVINVNDPPVILGAARTLSTPEETPLILTFDDFEVEDDDNIYPEGFSFEINSGLNYTVIDHMVIPNTKFLGKLDVGITMSDGQDYADGTVPVLVGVTAAGENHMNTDGLQMVYPVPPVYTVNFEFNQLKDEAGITLYDASLKQIRMYRIPAQTKVFQIDLHEFSPGIIFYKIEYKQSYDSGKFVITR